MWVSDSRTRHHRHVGKRAATIGEEWNTFFNVLRVGHVFQRVEAAHRHVGERAATIGKEWNTFFNVLNDPLGRPSCC